MHHGFSSEASWSPSPHLICGLQYYPFSNDIISSARMSLPWRGGGCKGTLFSNSFSNGISPPYNSRHIPSMQSLVHPVRGWALSLALGLVYWWVASLLCSLPLLPAFPTLSPLLVLVRIHAFHRLHLGLLLLPQVLPKSFQYILISHSTLIPICTLATYR